MITKLARIGMLTACSVVGSVVTGPPVASLRIAAVSAQENAPKAADNSSDDGAVIEPGKEELLGAMLGQGGAALPAGCTFESGQIERTLVKSTYKCSGGDVVLEVVHPSKAKSPVAKTSKFAIAVVSGTPPSGLVDEIVARVRAREAEFEWKVIERPVVAGTSHISLLVAGGGLAVLLLAVALLRRRSSSSKA